MMYTKWTLSDASQNLYMRHDRSSYEFIHSICCPDCDKETNKDFYRYYVNMYWVNIDEYGDEGKEFLTSIYGYHLPDLIKKYGEQANDIVAACFLEFRSVQDVKHIGSALSFEEAGEIIRNYINI